MSYTNEIIDVNAFYFASHGRKIFPRQIALHDTIYTFQDGLQYLVQIGSRAFKVFDMSDGEHTYRIRYENNTWTFIGIR